jgi:hypothetical protein
VDAFGTDEVNFITLLKGNWFLGIFLPTTPSYWTDVRYLAPWWVFPAGCQWMVLRHYTVLSRQENRCVLTYLWYMSHSKDLISLFGVLERCSETSAYQMIRLRWSASQVPVNVRNRSSPYPIWGLRSLIGPSSPPPRSFVFYPDYGPPWVDTYLGGG